VVVLDTSIIIDHLRTNGNGYLLKIASGITKQQLSISMLTIQKLYEGKSTKDKGKEKDMLATISPLTVLPYTYEIAQLAGEIARNLNRPQELADAAIAATAIVNSAQLATLNTKDFINITDLELLKLA